MEKIDGLGLTLGDVRVWVDKDSLKKLRENTLTREERENMIIASLNEAGWTTENEIYRQILDKFKENFEFIQRQAFAIPSTAYFKNGKISIRLGIYPRDSLNWIADQAEKLTDLQTGGWQRSHDFALETEVNQTVWKYEKEQNHEPGNILPIYKKGTILKLDGVSSHCQVDGLFQRNNGTWVFCEAKSHLTLSEVKSAEETFKKFEEYLELLNNTNVPEEYETLDNNRYWVQVRHFKNLNNGRNIDIVKYLGYRVAETILNHSEDPVRKALNLGFKIVEPTNDGFKVSATLF